jgi:hypothetical protein
MHLLLDESNGDGLGNELMEDVVEELRSQASAELGEDGMGGSLEEIKATEDLKPHIELELRR